MTYEHMTIEERLEKTVLAVEATRFEQMCLWEKFNKDCSWEQVLSGILPTIGKVKLKKGRRYEEMPVVVSLSWAVINGKFVMFYEPTSIIVDWSLVEDWLKKILPIAQQKEERDWKIDAINFVPWRLND